MIARILWANHMTMKAIVIRIFWLTSFLFFLLSPPLANADIPPASDMSSMTKTGESRVIEVVDPLTIKLQNGATVHLVGLNIPDLDPHDPGTFSVMTMKVLRDFLENEDVVIYQTKNAKAGRTNRMGHEMAHLLRKKDGIWVQGLLISLGLARVRTEKTNPEMSDEMYALEVRSRQDNSGLWAIDAYKVRSPEKAGPLIGSFAIVEGKILSVAMKKNSVYLNFGENWKKDFTVIIPSDVKRSLAKRKLYPLDWNGGKVRVRGWVSSLNGPSIEIDHPEALEMIEQEIKENKIDEKKEDAADNMRLDENALPKIPKSYSNKDRVNDLKK